MPRISKLLACQLLLVLALLTAQSAAVIAHAQPANGQPGWSSAHAVAEAEPGRIVKQAFDLLMDRFVIPPSSADILNGGWDAGVAALKEKGAQDAPEGRPDFSSEREADWRLFAGRYERLAAAADGKLEQAQLDRAIVRGMAASVNEGHTYYLTPEELQQAQASLRNDVRYAGVGIRLNRDLLVIEVFEGSPAEAGGVRRGDQLIAVDGNPVEGITPADASQKVRGEAGAPVEMTFRREGTPEPVRLTLVRAEIRVDWLASRILDDGVGYLLIRSFPTPDALGSFRQAMERFEAASIRALVIDVRANGGGSVDTGLEVISRFVRRGPVYQQVDRQGGQRTVTAFGDYWDRDVPIAVLADGGSGSMAEILASALQENGVAPVIGTKTSGNVAATVYHPLADGSGLAVTVRVIKSGQGKPLNGVGVEPDRTVELDPQLLRAGRDTQLDVALDYVRQEAARKARVQSLLPLLGQPQAI